MAARWFAQHTRHGSFPKHDTEIVGNRCTKQHKHGTLPFCNSSALPELGEGKINFTTSAFLQAKRRRTGQEQTIVSMLRTAGVLAEWGGILERVERSCGGKRPSSLLQRF
eukprot:2231186-Rhodomonas_salina.1